MDKQIKQKRVRLANQSPSAFWLQEHLEPFYRLICEPVVIIKTCLTNSIPAHRIEEGKTEETEFGGFKGRIQPKSKINHNLKSRRLVISFKGTSKTPKPSWVTMWQSSILHLIPVGSLCGRVAQSYSVGTQMRLRVSFTGSRSQP